ncbi:MAG: hypothetical protein JXR19_04170 [Bacteroidia bacterium]
MNSDIATELESLIILKTNIQSSYELGLVSFCLQNHPQVETWNVDEEDVDKVIRIQLKQPAFEQDYVQLLCSLGLNAEPF